jgi:hypothetical protein
MVYVIQTALEQQQRDQDGTAFPSWSCSKTVYKPVRHILMVSVQWTAPDDGQRNCPKHIVSFQNKFEKLVHLVGFIIRKFVTMHGMQTSTGMLHSLSVAGMTHTHYLWQVWLTLIICGRYDSHSLSVAGMTHSLPVAGMTHTLSVAGTTHTHYLWQVWLTLIFCGTCDSHSLSVAGMTHTHYLWHVWLTLIICGTCDSHSLSVAGMNHTR